MVELTLPQNSKVRPGRRHNAAAGAKIIADGPEIFAKADMIVKVKEPQAQERAMLREGQILYTYLHLAPDAPQAIGLMQSGAAAIAYETVELPDGKLPLLTPMSVIAGRLSIQFGARFLERQQGGSGVLLGGCSPGSGRGRCTDGARECAAP